MNEKELLEELIKSVIECKKTFQKSKIEPLKLRRELQRLKIEPLKLRLLWKMKPIKIFSC